MAAQVPGDSGPHRLLQILSDTEASDANLAALQLHRSLSRRGWEVRTLALSPGKHAELAASIPVMAPTRRSLAAVSQFRTEQAWADLVLLRGIRTAGVARLAGSHPKRVLALWSEPSRWAYAGRISKFEAHLLGSVDAVVVNSQAEVHLLAGTTGGLAGLSAKVAVAGAHPSGSLAAICLDERNVSASSPDQSGAGGNSEPAGASASHRAADAVAAARTQLGIGHSQIAVRSLHGDLTRSGRAHEEALQLVRGAVSTANARIPDHRGSDDSANRIVWLDGDDEASVLAADIVVVIGISGGPSVAVLDALTAGSIVVISGATEAATTRDYGLGDALITTGPGEAELADKLVELTQDPDAMTSRAIAGRAVVRERFSPEIAIGRWLECLTAALPSRP